MKIIAFVVALFVAAPVFAQDPSQFDPQRWFAPGCPSCGVHAYVDLPHSGSELSLSTIIAGWGFECVSGQPIDRVDVWYEEDGFWVPIKQADGVLNFNVIARPDVQTAYRAYCPNVALTSGWWMQLSTLPPAGARRVSFTIWRGPYYARIVRTYTVRP